MLYLTPTVSLLELIYTLLSLTGMVLTGYIAYDNYRDLRALHRQHANGYSRLTASIGIWDAVAAMIFHGLFLLLGMLALFAPNPPASRRLVADLFALGFILMQILILTVQGRNQLARQAIRDKLRRKGNPHDSHWVERCRKCVAGEEK